MIVTENIFFSSREILRYLSFIVMSSTESVLFMLFRNMFRLTTFILCVRAFCLHECVCMSEEGTGPPGTGVVDGRKL